MKTETETKRRGRPAGSVSFVRVRMSDLAKLVGSDASVPVSKIWLRNNGLNVTVAELPQIPQVIDEQPEENEPRIEFSLTQFD
jgi:hypothetical protein